MRSSKSFRRTELCGKSLLKSKYLNALLLVSVGQNCVESRVGTQLSKGVGTSFRRTELCGKINEAFWFAIPETRFP